MKFVPIIMCGTVLLYGTYTYIIKSQIKTKMIFFVFTLLSILICYGRALDADSGLSSRPSTHFTMKSPQCPHAMAQHGLSLSLSLYLLTGFSDIIYCLMPPPPWFDVYCFRNHWSLFNDSWPKIEVTEKMFFLQKMWSSTICLNLKR